MPRSEARADCLRLGDMVLELGSGRLLDRDGEPVALREQSLRVLLALAEHNGEIVGKDALVSAVWARDAVSDDSLVQCIKDIRSALGSEGQRLLRTAIGRGYSLRGVRELPAGGSGEAQLLVSPLRVRGGAAALLDLAEGLREDLIIALSQGTELRVTTDPSRRAEVLYAIDGRVSGRGGVLQGFLMVSSGREGRVQFARRWSIARLEAPAVSGRIAGTIANAVRLQGNAAAGNSYSPSLLEAASTSELLAWAAYHMDWSDLRSWQRARTCLTLAIKRDKNNARAHAMRAALGVHRIPQGSFADNPDDVAHCFELAKRAIALDPRLALAHRARGDLRLWLRGDHEGARSDCQRALSISRSCLHAARTMAASFIFAGEPRAGAAHMVTLMDQCSRTDPEFPFQLSLLALALLLDGDVEGARAAANEAHDRAPDDSWCAYVLAAASAHSGTRELRRRLRKIVAGIELPFSHFRQLPFTERQPVEMLEGRLRLAGFSRPA